MSRSAEDAFAQVRDAVAATLAHLAAAKDTPVSQAELNKAVVLLHRRVNDAQAQLPATLPPELERWMRVACQIKTDHITSLTTTGNVGGQKAAAATFPSNVARVFSDIETLVFVAGCVASTA